MFGLVKFVKAAGRSIGNILKGKDADEKLKEEVNKWGLDSSGMDINVDEDGKVSVTGKAVSQEMKEKIILALGNVEGVDGVWDNASVDSENGRSQFHTVVSGDTLSAISKTYYGSYKHYPVIFEANKPMLSDPDKIYPGQVLRIPPMETKTA